MKVRYTRWQDRLLARVWPPKRRQYRMWQTLVDHNAAIIQQQVDMVNHDFALYGTAYVGPDGKRIDPQQISR